MKKSKIKNIVIDKISEKTFGGSQNELLISRVVDETLKAINYSQCCKSNSEQLSFADMRDAFDYASVSSQRRDGMTFKEWISKR